MSRAGSVLEITFIGLALCACVQGHDYRRPAIETPTNWSEITPVPAVVSADRRPEVAWWEAFQNAELSELIQRALEQNHDIKQAIARILEGRASILSATAGLFPHLSLSGAYTNIAVSKNTLGGLGLATGQRLRPQIFATPGNVFDLWNGALDLRWEIDFWGRIRRGREAAEADTKAIEQDARAVALSLVSDVGQSYFHLRALDEQINLAMRTLTVRQESLDIVTKLATAGLASELDVKRTEVLVAEAAGIIPDLTRLRSIELHRLAVLTGMTPGSLELPSKLLRAVVVQPTIPVGLPSHLLERRPDILRAEATLVASNARIGQARAYFFPTLTITGQGGIQSTDFAKWFTGNSMNYSIGPSVTLPIFQGRTNLARLDQARSQYQQLLESYRQTILQAF
jgi:NodT family efflux transporter outer membrane factor (OMF) lipoprotein